MSIKQLNASYVPEEDRVLFRFTTLQNQEYRLWLTRSVIKEILSIGAQASVAVLAKEHPPEQVKAIAQFKQKTNAENAQFTTFEPAANFPIGGLPLLVNRCKLSLQSNTMTLEFLLVKGQVIGLKLTEEMISQMRILLQTIAMRANWGLVRDFVEPANAQAEMDATGLPANYPPKNLH